MDTTLCIPSIEEKISLEYVKTTFEKMRFGQITSIFEVPVRDGYKRIMIKMRMDEDTINGSYILGRINNGQNVKIVHNNPFYWKMELGRKH